MTQHFDNLLDHAGREVRRGLICSRCRGCGEPAGNLGRAALLCTCAVDMAPTDPRPYTLMAQTHLALNDLDAAMLAYRKLAACSADPGPALVEVARIHLARGRLSRASLWIERALELRPSVAAHALAAEINAQLGDPERELAHWRGAVAADPKSPEATYGLGLAHLRRGEAREARLAFERVLQIAGSGFRRTCFYLGGTYAMSNHWELASRMFESAVQEEPDHAPGVHGLGVALLMRGMAAEAIPHLRRAGELRPDSARYLADLSRAYLAAGQAEQAQRCTQACMALGAGSPVGRKVFETVKGRSTDASAP